MLRSVRGSAMLATLLWIGATAHSTSHGQHQDPGHRHNHDHAHDHDAQPTIVHHESVSIQTNDDGASLSFNAFGKHFKLQMAPQADTVSEGYMHTVYHHHGTTQLGKGDDCHFTATVERDPSGYATVSNCLTTSGQRRLMGSVSAMGEHLFFEPSDGGEGHIVYRHDDVINEGSCATGGHAHAFQDHITTSRHNRALLQQRFGLDAYASSSDSSSQDIPRLLPYDFNSVAEDYPGFAKANSADSANSAGSVVVEVYVISDESMASKPNHPTAMELVAQADAIFRNGAFERPIRLKLVGEESWVSGNKMTMVSDGDTLIKLLGNYKQSNPSLPPHDLLFLQTNIDLRGNTRGVANLGKICGRGSVALMQASSNLKTGSTIFAHEIAHLLGARHDGEAGAASECPNSGFIMSPNLSGLELGPEGECNTLWVGDGYCDVRCMKYNADGGDCDQRTHDDAGNPLADGLAPIEIGWSQCSIDAIDTFLSRDPTCLRVLGNEHTMRNEANMVGTVLEECNRAWVGDGYCDYRCAKYNNDGGDCDGRTVDLAGNPLPNITPSRPTKPPRTPTAPRQNPVQLVPLLTPSSSSSQCNLQWIGDGVCDHRCVAYFNDGGDCNGRSMDSSGVPLVKSGRSNRFSSRQQTGQRRRRSSGRQDSSSRRNAEVSAPGS